MLPFRSTRRIACESKTPSGPSSGISASSGRFLRKQSTREQHHVGVKLFGAAPDQAEAAHRLVAGQRVAAGGLHVFHVAAEDRGKQAGEKLRDRADQILLVADHVRRNLRWSGLEESGGQRLAGSRARGKMRGGLGGLIRERVEIEHLRIGVDRRDAVLVGFRLHVREDVVALLHLHERVADAGAILAVAGQRVQDAPVIVHRFVARFAVGVAGEGDVAAVGKQREQFVANVGVFDRVERPGTQPGAIEGDQVHQRVAGMDRRQALLDAEARDARVDIFGALRRRRFDFAGGVRVRGFQFRAMHFGLPLQVRIFVHLVGPDGRVEFEAAGDGDDFLAVGDAACAGDAGNGDALGCA